MTFTIAAAGTGGHVLPGLAIADALMSHGIARNEIMFLGGDRFESSAVPEAGYSFLAFRLARLQRSLTARNLTIPFVTAGTSLQMAAAMANAGTSVVIAMSGYVTVPAAMAARRVGAPLIIHEQNAASTLAARFGSRLARSTLLGLPGPSERLPRSEVVGNPLRGSLVSFDKARLREEGRRRYGIRTTGPVVGVIGGSLGAQVLNESAQAIGAETGATVVHLTGPAAAGMAPGGLSSPAWVRRPYESAMELFYAAVDLVVCRAGAMTVSELAATGTPSVLVPLERVGQMANAMVLEAGGGGLILRQADIGRLAVLVAELLGSPDRLATMATAAQLIARPDAADVIATRLIEIAGG